MSAPRLITAMNVCLAAIALGGCGAKVEKRDLMHGTDPETREKIVGYLTQAGIQRRPAAILDMGEYWQVALEGDEPPRPKAPTAKGLPEGAPAMQPGSAAVRQGKGPSIANEVIVYKTGEVKNPMEPKK